MIFSGGDLSRLLAGEAGAAAESPAVPEGTEHRLGSLGPRWGWGEGAEGEMAEPGVPAGTGGGAPSTGFWEGASSQAEMVQQVPPSGRHCLQSSCHGSPFARGNKVGEARRPEGEAKQTAAWAKLGEEEEGTAAAGPR